MIEVENLTKLYGDFRALDRVSFKVAKGEVLAFLGPNGAGKSTTMKILTGYLKPNGGTARVDGLDVLRDSHAVREHIGYLAETTPLYYDMQVNEFLALAARLRGIRGAKRQERFAWVVETCFLAEFWRKPIGQLSRGQKQRVGFAAAVLHDPKVLVLDEPTAGLDPNQIHEVRTLIKSFAGKKTIILSTHILQEVHAMCDRVVLIDAGRIVADSSVSELEQRFGKLERAFEELTIGAGKSSGSGSEPVATAGGESHDV